MLPADYEERVYAGVLGKIIGVYLGRPFEGWPNHLIEERLGEIDYYVHDKVGVRLVVTDDDISGTFTFIRALEDYKYDPQLTPKQIGQTWLNYLIDGRSVLWWGGLGNSTEHTAYLRLRAGIDAPQSGSIEMNGQVVAEQIGAQIFIDGWAMVNPGDPAQAADFARRAASVSHDGEAVYGAQILAAMEAEAFVEQDIDKLIDAGLAQVPKDALLVRMIDDIREWHAKNGDDWRATFASIKDNYGYDKYGGNCHIVPNHGLIVMGLLHGDGDFSRSMMIVNTAGWDTDCNSGNLGCLMGIRNGVDGIDAGPDWRGPFSDVCYLPTADSGGGISDAVFQTERIVAAGKGLRGIAYEAPKDGARYHFSYPGSVQGFKGTGCEIFNQVTTNGERSLAVVFEAIEPGSPARATTNTFIDSLETADYFGRRGYGLMTSPALNSGQIVEAEIALDPETPEPIEVALSIDVFNSEDEIVHLRGNSHTLRPALTETLSWSIPSTDGYPIAGVGLEIREANSGGKVYLNKLDWSGTPKIELTNRKGTMWHRAWVNGVDNHAPFYRESFRLIQNTSTGLMLYGPRDWTDYRVSADVTPHLVSRVGVAARVQGMRRYYALVLTKTNKLQLIRALDGDTVLSEIEFDLKFGTTYQMCVEVEGSTIRGTIDGEFLIEAQDDQLEQGGIALLIEGGRTATQRVAVEPIEAIVAKAA